MEVLIALLLAAIPFAFIALLVHRGLLRGEAPRANDRRPRG